MKTLTLWSALSAFLICAAPLSSPALLFPLHPQQHAAADRTHVAERQSSPSSATPLSSSHALLSPSITLYNARQQIELVRPEVAARGASWQQRRWVDEAPHHWPWQDSSMGSACLVMGSCFLIYFRRRALDRLGKYRFIVMETWMWTPYAPPKMCFDHLRKLFQ